MGFSERFSKIERPDPRVPPRTPDEVYRALLTLNSPDVPFVVRDGRPEGAGLSAEWKILHPEWRGFFGAIRTTTRTLMRLDPQRNEVRSMDYEFNVMWAGSHLTLGRESKRGQLATVEWTWEPVYDQRGQVVSRNRRKFSSRDIKVPLRETVTSVGWTWRGLRFGTL